MILKNELIAIKNEFATPRITDIQMGDFDQDIEDLIQREEMVVTVTLAGYIKRVPLDSYKLQNRGGKGRSGLTMRDKDITTQIFVANTHTPMLFFYNIGQVYSLKLYKLPLATPQSKGRPMVNILPLKPGEYINNIVSLPEDQDEWNNANIMFATSQGKIRKSDLSDFKRIQSNGKIAIRLDDNDNLVSVKLCKDESHILLATKSGKAIRFKSDSLRIIKSRTSDGVIAMKLAPNDQVISMTILGGISCTTEERESYLSIPLEKRLEIREGKEIIDEEFPSSLTKDKIIEMAISEEFILTVTENGFGKKTSAYCYRSAHRGGSGVVNIDISDKTGLVVAVMPVSVDDELMLITNNGKLIRCKLSNVRVTGRVTGGVILFKTEKNETVVSVSLIVDKNDSEHSLENDLESNDLINLE